MPIAGIYGPDDFEKPACHTDIPPRHHVITRAQALAMPSLEWTPEVERATAHLYERVKKVISPVEWPFMAPYVKAINELKRERNAVILAHNYQSPEIFHCVADIGGDSLQLAIEATKVKSVRRALHGGDFEAPEPRQDRPDPGFARRLFARLEHIGRRRATAARTLSRRASRRLCQHIGRGEGGGRHLLHIVERAAGGRKPQRIQRDLFAGPVSGQIRRVENQRQDHRLERRLRGA